VVERDHRLDPPVVERLEHRPVAVQRCRVDLPGRDLHPAPLDGEAQRLEAHIGGAIEVGLGVLPPIAGQACGVARGDAALLVLPGPPLIVGVLALHLVGGGGDAPFEVRGKVERCVWHSMCSLLHQ
jgi:hypothetical protein